jgi:hypothetical protein
VPENPAPTESIMIYPELRDIQSDLEPPALPEDPRDCAVGFRAYIGPRDGPDAEAYTFLVVTPTRLMQAEGPLWGRGYLIVDSFDWSVVVRSIAELLARCSRPSWDEVAIALNQELRWASGAHPES